MLGILGQSEVGRPGAPIAGLASTRLMGCRVRMPGGVPQSPGERLCVCLGSAKRETVMRDICELVHSHRVELASLQELCDDCQRVPLEYERKGGNDVRVLTQFFLPSSATASSLLHP